MDAYSFGSIGEYVIATHAGKVLFMKVPDLVSAGEVLFEGHRLIIKTFKDRMEAIDVGKILLDSFTEEIPPNVGKFMGGIYAATCFIDNYYMFEFNNIDAKYCYYLSGSDSVKIVNEKNKIETITFKRPELMCTSLAEDVVLNRMPKLTKIIKFRKFKTSPIMGI